jgi:PPOX class probable F420-dependent enzyme
MKEQRRGRRIAMSADDLAGFLGEQRTCRVATVGRDGAPKVDPLWFVWDGSALWLNSIVRSQRWANLARDARVAVVIDDGQGYGELRGAELTGRVEIVGEVPRGSGLSPELAVAEKLYGAKYTGGAFVADGRHAWLRLVPEKIVSWDFRKLANL